MDTKQIYIVLTQSHSILSKMIYHVTRDEYTHASIAFDCNLGEMYSFGRRRPRNPFIGCFRTENLEKGFYALTDTLPGLILELNVTPEQYEKAQEMINSFSKNSRYKYNYMGILYSWFRIHTRTQSQYRFVCSEFVYHVLHECQICDLEMPRNLVRPKDFLRVKGKVLYKGDLKKRQNDTVSAGL